jgi:hypothetical protein
MGNEKEMTLREATIFTLEQSKGEFDKLKESFKKAGDLFDGGNDVEGLMFIKEQIIPRLGNLYEFCFTLLNVFDDVIPGDLKDSLREKFESLDSLMKSVSKETEASNFSEVGDILRFDFYDLITELDALFPSVSEAFKRSTRADLNQI